MLRRIPQPPIDPKLRNTEAREFWPGLGIGIAGALLLAVGVSHLTAIETVDGGSARETQLVKAFAFGGMRYIHGDVAPAPPIPTPDDPGAQAAAMERWQRDMAKTKAAGLKIKVDTGSKTPCPT